MMNMASKLTSKCQVTIPKDVRAYLGVEPGERVSFRIEDDGRVFLVAADSVSERERRKAEFIANVAVVSAAFGQHDPLPGIDGLTFQRLMRGDGPEV